MFDTITEQEQRRVALDILRRSPVDLSRRASYGEEQRTEIVRVHWADGTSVCLDQSRDDRISFALRDRFEATHPSCRDQLAALLRQRGMPVAVTVAWSYTSTWEGEPPLNQRGRCRLLWPEMAELLALPNA